jgi:hypothetical protein
MRVKFEERLLHPIMVGRGSRFHLAPPQGDHVRLICSSLWRSAAEPHPNVCHCCGACAAVQWGVVLYVALSRTERGVGFLHRFGKRLGERTGTADEGRDGNSSPCEVALPIREPRPTSARLSRREYVLMAAPIRRGISIV